MLNGPLGCNPGPQSFRLISGLPCQGVGASADVSYAPLHDLHASNHSTLLHARPGVCPAGQLGRPPRPTASGFREVSVESYAATVYVSAFKCRFLGMLCDLLESHVLRHAALEFGPAIAAARTLREGWVKGRREGWGMMKVDICRVGLRGLPALVGFVAACCRLYTCNRAAQFCLQRWIVEGVGKHGNGGGINTHVELCIRAPPRQDPEFVFSARRILPRAIF